MISFLIDTEVKDDELYRFAERYNITAIPQLLVVDKSEKVAEMEIDNETSVEDIREFLRDYR